MRLRSRRALERLDRVLDAEWNGRLNAEARQAALVLLQCDWFLLRYGALYVLALLGTVFTQGLGAAFVVVFVVANIPPVVVLRVYARASRRMSAALGRSYGVNAELAYLLDRRHGWAGLDASAARLVAIGQDTPVPPPSGGWARREQRIAQMWGPRLDAFGVHALFMRSRWIALALLDLAVSILVLAFIHGDATLIVASAGVALLLLTAERMHAWKLVFRASAGRMLGLSPAAARMLPTMSTLQRFDAAAERARAVSAATTSDVRP